MRILLMTCLFLAQVCSAGERAPEAPAKEGRARPEPKEIDVSILANIDYGLTREEEERLSKQAMGGDAGAALRLANRYFFDIGPGPDDRNESRKNALKWALIGSENGSSEAQFLAYLLMGEGAEPLVQTRALYWLKRSAENGYGDAKIMYKQCPTISSK